MQENKLLNPLIDTMDSSKIVLLVDDDEDEHEIFSTALQNTNGHFNFVSAKSCENALSILKALEPTCIFIDLNMPKTNGITCLQEIKKITHIASVPVYLYSTGVNITDGQKALQLGAVDYIIKPNSVTTLTAVLKKILN